MSTPHQNARTTVHSRELTVARHSAGRPGAQIAAEFGVCVRTIYEWLRRFRQGGEAARQNRPSAPRGSGAAPSGRWRGIAAHLRLE